MTQQFKFGDRVRYKDEENPVLGVVLEEANPGNGLITVQFIDDAEPELVGSEDLEYVPHPDTVRLNWLINREKIVLEDDDGRFNVLNVRPENYDGLPVISHAANPREAIDQSMCADVNQIADIFKAYFEDMTADGRAEKMPDGRYKIFESGEQS